MLLVKKRGQLAMYVIIALVVLLLVLAVYFYRDNIVPPKAEPFKGVFAAYDDCITSQVRLGLSIAGSSGGHIAQTPYIPGSDFAPFSSHLGFAGFAVPYWYYVSGNGVIKEQVPSKAQIESELASFVQEGISECNFQSFFDAGYFMNMSQAQVSVSILDEKVIVDVNQQLTVARNGESASRSSTRVEPASSFGKLYSTARRVYDREKKDAFLEGYAVDVLRLYAPVDGVELSCSPKVWKTREVVDELKQALTANIGSLKLTGSYHTTSSSRKYFVLDEPIDDGLSANFLYLPLWPSKFEITGSSGELMSAEPVGMQEGMGMMGFCYAPYHFVYDINFPVMIQISSESEIFQFPVGVVIDKNLPRKAAFSEISEDQSSDSCAFATQDISVELYNKTFGKISGTADISYSCFDQLCPLGQAKDGVFFGKAPACLNGYVVARAPGYKDAKELFSSNSQDTARVFMYKEYPVELKLSVGGAPLFGNAMVLFDNGDNVVSAFLPDAANISLSEGLYNISVYVYSNSSIMLPATSKTECTQVPTGGLLGLFGGTKEQCFDIQVPSSSISSALVGGGKSSSFIFSSQLENGNLSLRVPAFSSPDSLEKLQSNYESFESSSVEVLYA